MQKWQYSQLWIDREGWNFWVYELDGSGIPSRIKGDVNVDPAGQREVAIAFLGTQGWEMIGVIDGLFFFKRPIE